MYIRFSTILISKQLLCNSSAKVERMGDIITALSRGYFSRSNPIKDDDLLYEYVSSWLNAGKRALRGAKQSSISPNIINNFFNSLKPYKPEKKLGKSRLPRNIFFELMKRHFFDLIVLPQDLDV